jgi:hypothetical protein
MIRPLRRVHRRVWQILALLLPVVCVLAVATRPNPLPSPPAPPPAGDGEVAWPGLPLALRPEAGGVRVRPTGPLPAPDLLLYASTIDADPGPRLPADAVFLGALGTEARRIDCPREARTLVLYSLAHGEVVSWTSPP